MTKAMNLRSNHLILAESASVLWFAIVLIDCIWRLKFTPVGIVIVALAFFPMVVSFALIKLLSYLYNYTEQSVIGVIQAAICGATTVVMIVNVVRYWPTILTRDFRERAVLLIVIYAIDLVMCGVLLSLFRLDCHAWREAQEAGVCDGDFVCFVDEVSEIAYDLDQQKIIYDILEKGRDESTSSD